MNISEAELTIPPTATSIPKDQVVATLRDFVGSCDGVARGDDRTELFAEVRSLGPSNAELLFRNSADIPKAVWHYGPTANLALPEI